MRPSPQARGKTMGMSTHVVGFRPPDELRQRMRAAWDACQNAGIDVPDEVLKFFNHEAPSPNGVQVDLRDSGCAASWTDDDFRQGYEVDLTRVPPGVTTIRFYNSY